MSPMPSLWGTGLAAPRGAQSWGWAWQRPTEPSELGGLWGKGFVVPHGSGGVWGAVGAGHCQDNPLAAQKCSELGLRAGLGGHCRPWRSQGGHGELTLPLPHLAQVFFQSTKSWARSRPRPALAAAEDGVALGRPLEHPAPAGHCLGLQGCATGPGTGVEGPSTTRLCFGSLIPAWLCRDCSPRRGPWAELPSPSVLEGSWCTGGHCKITH